MDPFPWTGGIGDKRYDYGTSHAMGSLPHPETYSDDEKLDMLVKGAALIVAEIDKLLRKRGNNATSNKSE